MMVVDGGGVEKDLSGGVAGEGGVLGGVKGSRLLEAEGETGGEHLPLHAGQFLFEDNHWKANKQRDIGMRSGRESIRTSIRWSKQKHWPQQRTFLGLVGGSKLW